MRIKGIKKRIVSIVSVFMCIIVMITTTANAQEKSLEIQSSEIVETQINTITASQAEALALMHVESTLEIAGEKSLWYDGVDIHKTEEIYDVDGNISAYSVELTNVKGEECGYVNIGATLNQFPIIEFSESGRFYACEIAEDHKMDVIYQGGLNYYLSNGDKDNVYDIKNGFAKKSKVKRGDIKQKKLKSYSKEWESVKSEEKRYQAKKSKINKNTTVSPDNEEIEIGQCSGSAVLSTSINVTGYSGLYSDFRSVAISNLPKDFYYHTTDNFSGDNNCAPTAATNVLKYNYYKLYSSNGKNQLGMGTGNSWDSKKTHSTLMGADYMATNVGLKEGTSAKDVARGYNAYFSARGLKTSSATYHTSPNLDMIVTEIKTNRPFSLHLIKGFYKDKGKDVKHDVACVGYYDYRNSSNNRMKFYAGVADGMYSGVRYVLMSDSTPGSDWAMTSVNVIATK